MVQQYAEKVPGQVWQEVCMIPVRIKILDNDDRSYQRRELYCVVESGSFEPGDTLYVDGEKSKPCVIYQIEQHNQYIASAEQGMEVTMIVYGSQTAYLEGAEYLCGPNAFSGSKEVEDYFSCLLHTHFKDYTIKHNMKMTSKEPAVPASFLLLRENKPLLAIILCGSQRYKRKKILNTMEACEQLGIAVQRYFVEFANDEDYVVDRVKSAL